MSSSLARNRIRLTVAALAVGATVTTVGATAQAAPLPQNQPTPDRVTPIASGSASNLDPGLLISGSAAAPVIFGGILLCEIGVNTGSYKWDPSMGGIPCLPI